MKRFENKVMIITGAASGVGKTVALQAAKEGANLVLADVNEEAGRETMEEIKEITTNIEFLFKDLSKNENCKAVVDTAVTKFGGVDILINNAGIMGPTGSIDKLTEESFRRVLDINLMIPFFFSNYAIKAMLKRKRGGAIVNVSSLTALNGSQGNCAYITSKAAVNGLTKTMALDYAKDRIRVNAVCPSTINTPMYREALERVKQKIERLNSVNQSDMGNESARRILAHQDFVIEPEDVAHAILYLASEESNNITGTLIPIDGGVLSF